MYATAPLKINAVERPIKAPLHHSSSVIPEKQAFAKTIGYSPPKFTYSVTSLIVRARSANTRPLSKYPL